MTTAPVTTVDPWVPITMTEAEVRGLMAKARALQATKIVEIINDIERVYDAKMWRDRAGDLQWRGETPDGNEIETENPRTLLARALVALREL